MVDRAQWVIQKVKNEHAHAEPFYWRLISPNGGVIAHSGMYATSRERDDVAKSVALDFRPGRCTIVDSD